MAIPIQEATINLLGFFTVDHTFMMSAVLAVGWVLLYFMVWVLHLMWAWFDDAEVTNNNWIVTKNCKMWGYAFDYHYEYSPYIKAGCKRTDGDGPWLWTWLVLMFTPFLLLFMCLNPMIVIMLVTAASLAFVARFVRRYQKLFIKHTKDKNAHNQ